MGLYKVPKDVTIWKSSSPEDWALKLLAELWLFELETLELAGDFIETDVTQQNPDLPLKKWQIAYDPRFLDPTGTQGQDPQVGRPARVIFFFHYLRITQPVLVDGKELRLPNPSPFPDRLRNLVDYNVP